MNVSKLKLGRGLINIKAEATYALCAKPGVDIRPYLEGICNQVDNLWHALSGESLPRYVEEKEERA